MPKDPSTPHSPRAARAGVPPGAPSWVSAELLQKTQEIWGKRYKREIGSKEALGIILRVSALIDALFRR
jgi:hypothetical protein